MYVHYVPARILLQDYLSVSKSEVRWLVVSNCLLHVLNILWVVRVVQCLPKRFLTLPDLNVPSFGVLISVVVELVVYVKSCLLEVGVCCVIINKYRTCPKTRAKSTQVP
jgi:hypothetical protein